MRLLIVTAVEAERAAVQRGIDAVGPSASTVTVIAGGVGTANAAAATAELVVGFDAVISAGIGGGFDAPPGALVLATASVAADLGAESPDGFLSLDELGFGSSTVECDGPLLERLRRANPLAPAGPVLTVTTVTGTADRAAWLRRRHPGAVAEAMEGFGVATAAARRGIPFGEVRAISNPVGPRDRGAWRIGDALEALATAMTALAGLERPSDG